MTWICEVNHIFRDAIGRRGQLLLGSISLINILMFAQKFVQRSTIVGDLQNDNQMYGDMMEYQPDGMMIVDRYHNVVKINKKMLRLLGFYDSNHIAEKLQELLIEGVPMIQYLL